MTVTRGGDSSTRQLLLVVFSNIVPDFELNMFNYADFSML